MDEASKKVVDLAVARMRLQADERGRSWEKGKKALSVTVLLSLFALVIYQYSPQVTTPALNAQQPVTQQDTNGAVQVTAQQGAYGHYRFLGYINGKPVKFLLDTGATHVAIPRGVANYLELPFGESYYSQTANGKSLSYGSFIKQLAIGGISVANVDASVVTGMEGDEILLGMSFLKHLDVQQKNGQLVLTQMTLPVHRVWN